MKLNNRFVVAVFSFFMAANAHGFDVGGLVSDGNGGYSDVGFDGIAGSGDLGISDADLGGGFGVADNGDTGTNGSSSGSGSEGLGGGEADQDQSGQAGQGGSDSRDDARHTARDIASARLTSHGIHRSTQPGVHAAISNGAVLGSRAQIDHVNALNDLDVPSGQAVNDLADHVNGIVDQAVETLRQLSGGVTTGTINLMDYKFDDRSNKVLTHLLNSIHKGGMVDPLVMLGLKGAKMLVYSDLPTSFYAKDLDTIFIARKDITRYGGVVLYHELLHAGLEKARISGAISEDQYNYLSDLGVNQFPYLDGYAGSSHGLYQNDGYGYQEAFAIGWSYYKLEKHYKKLPPAMQTRSENYLKDILNNIVVAQTPEGQNIRMIGSGLHSHNAVKYWFVREFKRHASPVRNKILEVQNAVRAQLPSLCTPGEERLFDKKYCGDRRENSYSFSHQVCQANYRFKTIRQQSCGGYVREAFHSPVPQVTPRLSTPLSNICTPGETRRVNVKSCLGNWSNSQSFTLQRCTANFKFKNVSFQDCGDWSR